MPYLLSAGIAIITAVASLLGVVNYMPISVLENASQPRFGTSVTTINGSDTLSSSRTTINNNFSALNTGKIEISTTTLPLITTLTGLTTVGTIGNGSWNATAIPVNKGGTGTTSPSTYQVLLGNGANGITVASSTGISGQYLTSNGAGAYPSWQTSSVDQAGTYTWTGANMWTASTTHSATTTISASSVTNNALVLNGISYAFPSIQAASSTVLQTNGSGKLMWGDGQINSYVSTATSSASTGNAYTIDTTYTTTFKPTTITIYFWLTGTDGSGTQDYSEGVSTHTGTASTQTFYSVKSAATLDKTSADVTSADPYSGTSGTNSLSTLSVIAVTDTSYTVRQAFTGGSTYKIWGAKWYSVANK